MSEADYQRQLMEAAAQHKMEERLKARDYLLHEYPKHGLSEAERDELLDMLGISTEYDCRQPLALCAPRALPSAGLASGTAKAVVPRTPPTRASYL